jgi:hypothetical protein
VTGTRLRSGVLLAALLCLPLAACGDELRDEANQQAQPGSREAKRQAQPGSGTEAGSSASAKDPSAASVEPARCPADVQGCRTASGTILYVEAVDPDGDGDAHFILASREGISAPGVSVIDVRRDLRPDPLPRVGERINAVGPVYPGSYGQRQIEAVVLHTESAAG